MKNSILHFSEDGIKNLQKAEEIFAQHPEDLAGYVKAVREEVLRLGLDIIQETLEIFDSMLRASQARKEKWEVVRKDEKQLVTSLGTVYFEKTLFRDKVSKKSAYLLDDFLHLEHHQRMTEDAVAELLKETAETSYRRGGDAVSLADCVSKEAVKDVIHKLKFPCMEKPEKKKEVEYLYIDADEDHVALQCHGEKEGNRGNCVLAKIVYVYEGVEKDAPKSKRRHLVNPHYFCGTYEGKENRKLWDEVYQYIEDHYEMDKIKKIFLNADGGTWITAGKRQIKGITFVLDEFHMRKYLTKMTSHMLDSADEVRSILCNTILKGTREDFREGIECIAEYETTEAGRKRVREAGEYILSNWSAAKLRLSARNIIKGCSAEGHVSHVLSARMSSRPMGWSRTGADKMSRLRAYKWNGGDMLELVRYQKKEQVETIVTENAVLSSHDVMMGIKEKQSETEKYAEIMNCSVNLRMKKHIYNGIYNYIWRLK